MEKFRGILLVPALGVLLFFSACEGNDDGIEEPANTPATLVQSTEVFTRPAGDLRGFISISGLDVDLEALVYDVTLFKIEYTTSYKGGTVTASAVVLAPVTEEAVSTISFQHGTIASNAEAPSNLTLGDGQIILASALASTGHLVILPDFIGFGASSDVIHPYYVEEPTATSVIDAIYAARQVADESAMLLLDEDLYLAGYSQGGYATMATHKYIEEHGMDFFELKASFPASGGYDIEAFRQYFFSLETYDEPFYLAYVATAYQVTYDWPQPLSMFFNEPFASAIPGYFDGSYRGSQINALLNDTISVLLSPDFIANVDNQEYAFMKEAFLENSLTDWVPVTPMYMYHGDADITVPYQNSVDVHAKLVANGASADVVTFTNLPGGTHGTGVVPYIEHFVAEILEMEEGK